MAVQFRFFFSILLFVLQSTGYADTIVYSDGQQKVSIGIGIDYFLDYDKSLHINDFLENDISFTKSRKKVLNFENFNGTVWLRFSAINKSELPLLIAFGNPELDLIEVFAIHGFEVIEHNKSGRTIPQDTRYLHNNKVNFILHPNATEYIVKIESVSMLYLPMTLGSASAISSKLHQDDLFNGAVVGILLVMLLYNFFIFLATRDKVYLMYCLYLSFSTFLIVALEGLIFNQHWSANHLFNPSHLPNVLSACTAASAIFFSVRFLEITNKQKLLLWANGVIIAYLALGVYVELFVGRSLANILVQSGSGLTALYLFFVGIYFLIKGQKRARFYVVSWGVLLIGAIAYVLTLNGILPVNFVTQNSFKMASVAESVMLSIALADRINTYRREKTEAQKRALNEVLKNERLIKDQNLMLENQVQVRTQELMDEKLKSDQLLLNILPAEIAEELKTKGNAEAKWLENATVLFTDFKNFTALAETLSPTNMVKNLHECFTAFDNITQKYGLEKIKTIGDAYMAAGGLPVPTDDSVKNTVLAALEMQAYIVSRKANFDAQNSTNSGKMGGVSFDMRVGIHTGPVVAGIVGVKKFQYDIWGDTVNTAARMEQNSEVGKVNISQNTYEMLKDDPEFAFESRGKIEAKGKGEVEMYFVSKNKQFS